MPSPPPGRTFPGMVHDLDRRLTSVEAKVPRPEATQSLYDAQPKGIVGARLVLTTNSAATPAGNTDMTITRPVLAGNSYRLHANSGGYTISAAADWIPELRADGTHIGELGQRRITIGADSTRIPFGGAAVYEAAADADVVFTVAMKLVAGSGTVTFTRSATATSQLWLEHIGLT